MADAQIADMDRRVPGPVSPRSDVGAERVQIFPPDNLAALTCSIGGSCVRSDVRSTRSLLEPAVMTAHRSSRRHIGGIALVDHEGAGHALIRL